MMIADRCICLRKVEFSETSQILHLLAREHGIVHVMAKGAHRRTKAGASKFDGGVDLLDLGSAVFIDPAGKDLATLTEWHQDDGHLELRRSLRAIYLAQFAAELVNELLETLDPMPDLFDRLEQTLPALATASREEAFLAFHLDVINVAGFLPELTECGICQSTTNIVAFSPSHGTVICRNCLPQAPRHLLTDVRLLNILRSLLKLPRVDGVAMRLPRLTRHQTDPLNRLLIAHVQHAIGKALRLRTYVLGPETISQASLS